MYTFTELAFCAPPWSEVLPAASTLNCMPGTVSANSRKLRVSCGTVSICCCETMVPISEVLTSARRWAVPETVTVAIFSRSSTSVVATFSVTVCCVPGPASTL